MHPIKKIQHLAARLLLQELAPHLNLDNIVYASNGKPFIKNENIAVYISEQKQG